MDMVHFEDLRVTFDRMDWYHYSDLFYTLFWTVISMVMKLCMLFS